MTLTCLLDKTRGSVMDMRHVQVKRSPQEAAEGEEKPPVWCSFALPWRLEISRIVSHFIFYTFIYIGEFLDWWIGDVKK